MMVAMAMVVVRGDELEKLKPRRFCEQISKRARSFSVCAMGFFFFFFFGGWWLRLWLGVVAMAVVRGDELEKLRPWRF